MDPIPMFPLGMTVLPGAVIPLQVFEPRYVEMVHDLLASDDTPAFGCVLIERGHEVGGHDDRNEIGTLVRVADMHVTPDGRYLLACVGVERIKVVQWLPDAPYPKAHVTAWADGPSPVDGLETALAAVVAKAEALAERVRSLGHEVPKIDDGLSEQGELALYQLAERTPIGAADRYRVLAAPSALDRCAVLSEVFDDAMAVIEFHRS